MFYVNLQLFGGGGSKSGLGGKGKGGGKGEGGVSKGYLFYFYKDGKKYLRWVEGETPNDALKNAESIAKNKGFFITNPMGDHMTYDDAKKKIPGLKQAGAKK